MGKQHVDIHRKLMLRRLLLKNALGGGAVYVPFIGDGDIASDLYRDRRIFGADLDAGRVKTAQSRLGEPHVVVAGNCDVWPFPPGHAAAMEPYTVADFDAYSYPYHSFRAWWTNAQRSDRMVLFFTDGQGQAIIRSGFPTMPDGRKFAEQLPLVRRRQLFNFWYAKELKPWFAEAIKPYRIEKDALYKRGMMIYWGAVIQR